MTRKALWSSVLLYWFAVVLAFSIGVPSLNLDELIRASDLVCVAEVTDIEAIGPAPPISFRGNTVEASLYSATLLVKKTLKGVAGNQLPVTYSVPKLSLGYRRPQLGTRLVFLRKDGEHYVFTSPYYPDLPAIASDNGTSRSAGDNPLAMAIAELAAVISSSSTSADEKMQIMQVSYALPANEYVRDSFREGLSKARGTDLGGMLQSELVRLGDVGELPGITQALLKDSLSSAEKDRFSRVIANSVYNQKAAPYVEQLARSEDESLRAAAMEALWHIGSSKSTDTLVAGLADRNREVRYYAVRALARIAGQPEWEPSVPEFRQHEQRYLNHWQQWASSVPR